MPTTKKNEFITVSGGLLVLYVVAALSTLGYLGIAFMALDDIYEVGRIVNQRSFDLSLRYVVFNAVVAALLAGFGAWFLTLINSRRKLAKPVGTSFISLSFLYALLEYGWYQDLVVTIPELGSYTNGVLSLPLLLCLIYLICSERAKKTLVA